MSTIQIDNSVGPQQKNSTLDVVKISYLLRHQTKKNYIGNFLHTVESQDLFNAIAAFQKDHGIEDEAAIVNKSSKTFSTLIQKLKQAFKGTLFVKYAALSVYLYKKNGKSNNSLSYKQVKAPRRLYNALINILQKTPSNYTVLQSSLQDDGSVRIILGTGYSYYDESSGSFVNGFSDLFKEFLNFTTSNSSQKWSINIDNKQLICISDKNNQWRAPYKFSEKEKELFAIKKLDTTADSIQKIAQILFGENQEKKRTKPTEVQIDWQPKKGHEQKFMSILSRPLARVVSKPEGQVKVFGRELTNHKSSMAGAGHLGKNELENAAEIADLLTTISGNQKYNKVVNFAYRQYYARLQRAKAHKKPLVLLSASFEANLILGAKITLGVVFDPNTEKEYIYVSLRAALGLSVGGGFSGGIDTINKDIKDVAGFGYGLEKSGEIQIGPISITFNVKSGNAKFPEINIASGYADAISKNYKDILKAFGIENPTDTIEKKFADKTRKLTNKAFEGSDRRTKAKARLATSGGKRNILRSSAEVDLETGKTRRQEDIKKEKARGGDIAIPIAQVDAGIIEFNVAVKPRYSNKLKASLGAEAYINYTLLFDISFNAGLVEKAVYSFLRDTLPDL